MRKNIFAICSVVALGLAVMTIPAMSQQDKASGRVLRHTRNVNSLMEEQS